jgi:GNAT superfamily N-acetyltransferase
VTSAVPDVPDAGAPDRELPNVTVRRVEGRHGLAVLRAALPPVTLVTTTPEGTVVRTPSRPDFHDGNVLDLARVPDAAVLGRALRRAEEQSHALGARLVRLRFEEPLAPDAAPGEFPSLAPSLAAACAAEGLAHHDLVVLLRDAAGAPSVAAPAGVELVGPLPAEGDAALDRRWHGAAVLQRYADGDDVAGWRDVDAGLAAWAHGVRRALALAGRARVLLAVRQGIPVGTVTLAGDGAGTAVVEDLVVHPVHRGLGIATALVHRAVSDPALAAVRVGSVVVPGSASERLHRRLGFRPHAVVRILEREPGAPAADGRGGRGPRG